MRLANDLPRIHQAGGEVVAVAVDPAGRNAAFQGRWRLPFRIESDADGERFLKPLDLWNPNERGGIGVPALLVVSPQGEEVFRVRSRDFADRVNDEDALKALEDQGYPPLDPPPAWRPQAQPDEERSAFSPQAYGAYFRGNRFAAHALALRVTDPASLAEIKAHRDMAISFLAAWKARRETEG